jgi:hypothetical protein
LSGNDTGIFSGANMAKYVCGVNQQQWIAGSLSGKLFGQVIFNLMERKDGGCLF